MNLRAGGTAANGVVATLAGDGRVAIVSPLGPVDVVVDADGYFGPAG